MLATQKKLSPIETPLDGTLRHVHSSNFKKQNVIFSLKKTRKHLYLLCIFCCFFIGCEKKIKKDKQTKIESKSSVKINVNNASNLESFQFCKGRSFNPNKMNPITNPIEVTLDESINDLYMLVLKTEKTYPSVLLALEGNDITIELNVKEDKIIIDTIIGAPSYYYAEKILKDYTTLALTDSQIAANEFLLEEIKKKPNSSFVNTLTNQIIQDNHLNKEELKKIKTLVSKQDIKLQTKILGNTPLDKLINATYMNFSDFKFSNRNGEEEKISLDHNSIYLIDFWFVGCAPCIADHKRIKSELYPEFKKSGVKIIGMSIDPDHLLWSNFVKKNNHPWQNYRILKEFGNFADEMAVSGYPTYFVVDGKNKKVLCRGPLQTIISFLKKENLMI